LEIPCACMTPNDRRVACIVDLAKQYNVDGVVYYTSNSVMLTTSKDSVSSRP